jgi:hypothetical protein
MRAGCEMIRTAHIPPIGVGLSTNRPAVRFAVLLGMPTSASMLGNCLSDSGTWRYFVLQHLRSDCGLRFPLPSRISATRGQVYRTERYPGRERDRMVP